MILVTGANGFVGSALVETLSKKGLSVKAASRTPLGNLPSGCQWVAAPNLTAEGNWHEALQSIACVIHCAARVHVMNETSANPLQAFRAVNVEGTKALALQAAKAGVKRFVFLSSIKVNGESTDDRHPFTAQDQPAPEDAYGLSKLEAEQALFAIARETDMEVVMVRSPLVYGPGVKANFEQMMKILAKGLPLPLGAVKNNRRSMVALGNLTDLLAVCAQHENAANQVFLASDGEDLSTASLLKQLGKALGKPARLFPVPLWLLRFGAKLIGKTSFYQRLCGSLQIELTKTLTTLNWQPPVSVDEGLKTTAQHWLEHSPAHTHHHETTR